MKQYIPKIAAILLLFFVLTGVRAQRIYFNFTDGTNAAYDLVNVRKITLTEDTMNLHLASGTTYTWKVSMIRNYDFSERFFLNDGIVAATIRAEPVVYPNPTNGNLTIRFHLAADSWVRINWFSIDGKLLQTIFEKDQQKGERNVIWNAANFSNGEYICQITTKAYAVSKIIVLDK